ncbi:unnamed protein product [Spirodela intermedia]|uniref:Uncharacterized protein n=1 Tax=Spirodela intermedia TaxID=51605 RepID=A0A7I8LI89_SPIIN|nr:unnamed protein product [Spirodela intermedia]
MGLILNSCLINMYEGHPCNIY